MSFLKCKDFIKKNKKKTGLTVSTSFKIECISEPGKDYRVEIKESVGEYTRKGL